MLLMPLPKGVDHTLLDANGSVARSDGLQVNLIGMVDLSQGRAKLSHLLKVFRVVLVIWVGRAQLRAANVAAKHGYPSFLLLLLLGSTCGSAIPL
jgi:hypothetical protein